MRWSLRLIPTRGSVVRREPIEAEFEIEMEYVTVNSPLEDGAIIARTRIRPDKPPPKPVT
jgi:hypothetical protein